jgi:hypothetical protein
MFNGLRRLLSSEKFHFFFVFGFAFFVALIDALQIAKAEDSDFPCLITAATQRSSFFGIV